MRQMPARRGERRAKCSFFKSRRNSNQMNLALTLVSGSHQAPPSGVPKQKRKIERGLSRRTPPIVKEEFLTNLRRFPDTTRIGQKSKIRSCIRAFGHIDWPIAKEIRWQSL